MEFNIELDSYTHQEIKRLMGSLGSELTELNQLLYLIDKVWDEIGCDNQMLDEDKMTKFYDHPVWILNGLFAEQDPLSLQHRHAISKWITDNRLEKILDFGGGVGTLARMIIEKNSTTRVDIYEPYPSEFAVSRCEQNLSINFVSSIEHDYDCIISTDVLEHVTDPLHLLDKLIQSIKVGGHLVIANCFYPSIKCHLPLTFHLRYTFDRFAIAMGLEVIGNCTGSHATIYKKVDNHPVDWEKIERMSLVSQRLFFLRELQ
jgi:2-polyprenyl-6-hydroxyphenyl methylase/3-demethylubiquinone-9 3-methyltransferase